MTQDKRVAPEGEAPLFDFEDLQALRDEYEERLAKVERERTATVDVMKKESDNRVVSMQRDYEARLANEAASRQELIHELTFELAAAREEGERRAQEADKRRLVVEQHLAGALSEIGRIEGEVQRLKDTLLKALPQAVVAPAAPVAASASTPPVASQQVAPQPTPAQPPPLPADAYVSPGPSAAVAAYAPANLKKKKIRLR